MALSEHSAYRYRCKECGKPFFEGTILRTLLDMLSWRYSHRNPLNSCCWGKYWHPNLLKCVSQIIVRGVFGLYTCPHCGSRKVCKDKTIVAQAQSTMGIFLLILSVILSACTLHYLNQKFRLPAFLIILLFVVLFFVYIGSFLLLLNGIVNAWLWMNAR